MRDSKIIGSHIRLLAEAVAVVLFICMVGLWVGIASDHILQSRATQTVKR